MKAILEFNLDEPYEQNAHARAINGTKAYIALYEMDNYLRNQIKYTQHSDEVEVTLQSIRDVLYEIMSKNNIDLNDLE